MGKSEDGQESDPTRSTYGAASVSEQSYISASSLRRRNPPRRSSQQQQQLG